MDPSPWSLKELDTTEQLSTTESDRCLSFHVLSLLHDSSRNSKWILKRIEIYKLRID